MIHPKHVHETLSRHQLADGFPIVLDLEASRGSWLRDAITGDDHLDLFTCFASWPVGYNHPGLHDAGFVERLVRAARHNPANSDLYTSEMADFVATFAGRVSPDGFDHHFWVAGGALAVENAMKTAFDWKAHKIGVENANDGRDLSILHFRQAFHGRSGYTLSVTNTVPDKVALFPKFDWPRVHNPAVEFDPEGCYANDPEAEEARACEEIEAAFAARGDSIAAILIEPIQGEGGDNHFRPEFFCKLREYADRNEALLMYDEVQTGFFGSGKPWMWEHHGVAPDVVAFGKKSQVCGIYAGPRIDEVEENVFRRSSRINSTWGGNLVDMVRSQRIIEIILEENLHGNVAERGREMIDGLRAIQREKGGVANVRGAGSLVAFTLETAGVRDSMLRHLASRNVLALASGPRAIRFRMPLVITGDEVATCLERVSESLPLAVAEA